MSTPPAIPPAALAGDSLVLTATDAHKGERVDRFLADNSTGLAGGALSRSRVKSLIERGLIYIDATPLRDPSATVRAGGVYTITLPAPVAAQPQPEAIPFTVLYEDAHLIVLDKPAGLVVHPAPGNETGTLVNALLAHCGDSLPGIGGERRPGIVHRLDKDTSGVMVVAKTESCLAALSAAFAARDLDRSYLALCWGLPNPSQGDIEGAIGRDPRDRKRMAVVERGGKPALTSYKVQKVWHMAVAMMECRLATGRTHQIRVHMATKGHPLLGDPVYLRRVPALARSLSDDLKHAALDFPRQALHAARLGFRHPATGQDLLFETPPPADLQMLIKQFDMSIPTS